MCVRARLDEPLAPLAKDVAQLPSPGPVLVWNCWNCTMTIDAMQAANDKGAVLIAGMSIVGDVSVEDDIDVQGQIDGSLRARTIRISKSGQVSGTLIAERVEVFGTIEDGAIIANSIALRDGCEVDADLYYRALELDEGALFEGKSRRHDNPMSLAPAAMPLPST